MSDAVGLKDQQGWMTPAFEELRSNLDYARDLVRGGQHLERLKVGAFDVADLYRAAWVQAVSALDHWVHRELYERALGFALNVEVRRPAKFLTLQVPMGLFEDVHHHSKTLREAFVAHLRTQFGYQSFQAPDKIKQALCFVSDVPLWSSVARQLSDAGGGEEISHEQILADLRNIVQRRNKIAHEADRNPEWGRKRQPISDHEATQTIDRIERIATAIAVVLGSPPAGTLVQSVEAVATGATPTNSLYREFWSRFQPIAKRRGWTNASPPAQNWWTMPAGVTGAVWVLSFARFGCRSELYFEHPDAAVNSTRWRVLADRREDIVANLGDEVIFDELPKNKGCRIELRLMGPKIGERERWPEIIEWMEDSQVRLRSAIDVVGGVPSILAPTEIKRMT